MAPIKIHGGDFVVGRSGAFKSGVLTLPTSGVDPDDFLVRLLHWHPHKDSYYQERIPLKKVMRVDAVNKEMKHRTGAALGRGALAAMIAGPIGSVDAVLGGPAAMAVAATSAIVGILPT